MKCFIAIFFIAVSVLVSSEAAVERPDKVIARIGELKEEVFAFQDEIVATIAEFRLRSGRSFDPAHATGNENRTLKIVGTSVMGISAADLEVRAVLDAQAENACIANLRSFLDQILELSGFATSNCILLRDDRSMNGSSNFADYLEAVEKDASLLGEIFVNALIGRNVFTQGAEIIARIEELWVEQKESFTAAISALRALEGEVGESWETTFGALHECMNDIIKTVSNSGSIIAAQLPICAQFGGRGARSAIPILPDPKAFFPKLQ